jgi:Protein of unknown function (DUF2865)
VARIDFYSRFQRVNCALAGAVWLVAVSAAPASAQGLFDFLFGGFKSKSEPTQSYADPNAAPGSESGAREGGGGRGLVYCVRLCDGRHFPISNHAGANAAEMCRSFCPYAPTQIFSGSKIDYAVAPGGKRYSELPNAFVYREKLVGDCSCDGKSPTGLVRLDSQDDPTLRSGDLVATGNGLMAYRGGNGTATQFTAISNTPGISANMRQQLTATRVAPGRKPAEDTPDPEADGEAMMSRNVNQRDQASR